MLSFKPLTLQDKEAYEKILRESDREGCEYSFVNQFIWGRQEAAFFRDGVLFFSRFDRRCVYLFPMGLADPKAGVDALLKDAESRGIDCCLTSLSQDNVAFLERAYPGRFSCHTDRDGFDYVYPIEKLAQLGGRAYQKKRNHYNRFAAQCPDYTTEPITRENLPRVQALARRWYALRCGENPCQDYALEKAALDKALRFYEELGLEGLLLSYGGQDLAFTVGSLYREDTFDIHFEKALDRVDGTYTAINRDFARYLQETYPSVRWLNREDDMGLEGLRKAKLSYVPEKMVEKSWACFSCRR